MTSHCPELTSRQQEALQVTWGSVSYNEVREDTDDVISPEADGPPTAHAAEMQITGRKVRTMPRLCDTM